MLCNNSTIITGGKMKTPRESSLNISEISKNLVTFAIDRDDLKMIMGQIPPSAETNRVVIEYELQLLKILSTGWSISFFMEDSQQRLAIAEQFWVAINEFSTNLSQISATAANTDIDYFQQIRNRLDLYIEVINHYHDGLSATTKDKNSSCSDTMSYEEFNLKNMDIENLASVVGPAFADCCGDKKDPFSSISGAKMFSLTVGGVREYLKTHSEREIY